MAGRPTEYKKKFCSQVEKLCRLGATDKEIADFFNVSATTISNWKEAYPEFLESIKKGKIVADLIVANSLFKRANGYSHPEVDIKMYEGKIIKTPLVKHYPPDTTAAIFWLKNRRGKVDPYEGQKWADKQEIDHTSGGEKLPPAIIKWGDKEIQV